MSHVPPSGRWYPCTGCGKWHPFSRQEGIHYSMYAPPGEPTERNFEGTPDELARFKAWRELVRMDNERADSEAENRIDRLLSEPKWRPQE